MHEIVLTGLRGNTPIGAMAAFGLLRLRPQWRLYWPDGVAAVQVPADIPQERLVEDLVSIAAAKPEQRREFQWTDKPLKDADPGDWLAAVREAEAQGSKEQLLWLGALGVARGAEFRRTPFDFTSGSQKLLDELANLPPAVTRDSLQEALFGPWLYRDSTHSLGWDPTMLRSGAFTAEQPRLNRRNRGVTATVWLASESLPLFPCFLNQGASVVTRGWVNGEFRWPLWDRPISVCNLISLLSSLDGHRDVVIYGAGRSKAGRQSGFGAARLICED